MAHKLMPVALHKNHWKGGKKPSKDVKQSPKEAMKAFVSGKKR